MVDAAGYFQKPVPIEDREMPRVWSAKVLIKPWICPVYLRIKSNFKMGLKAQPETAAYTSYGAGGSPSSALALQTLSPPPLPVPWLWAPLASKPLIPGGSGLALDLPQLFWRPNFSITCADTILISFNMSFFYSWEMYVCSGICPHLPLWKERQGEERKKPINVF